MMEISEMCVCGYSKDQHNLFPPKNHFLDGIVRTKFELIKPPEVDDLATILMKVELHFLRMDRVNAVEIKKMECPKAYQIYVYFDNYRYKWGQLIPIVEFEMAKFDVYDMLVKKFEECLLA